MTVRFIDLSEGSGHERDHGFRHGAEFDVRVRRVNVPDFAREHFSEDTLDDMWWQFADQHRKDLEYDLRKRYPWVGRTMFVGRGPGWLAIEDTVGRKRNWAPIADKVTRYLKNFVAHMEDEGFWRGEVEEAHGR